MIEKYLNYLYKLEPKSIKYDLGNMKSLMKILGNPQEKLKIIHITGTNGKGSTANFVQRVLTESGNKTGLYTSPHINKINERIKINNSKISNKKLIQLIKMIKSKIDKFNSKSKENLVPSTFEMLTAIAFVHFNLEKTDYVVLEVGLGGTLDATNIISKSIISAITNISLDHQNILGKTTKKICKDKCGIIKEKSTFITTEENNELLKIMKNFCKKNNSFFIPLNEDLEKIKNLRKNLDYQEFLVGAEKFKLKMLGDHQIKNSYLAYKIVEQLFKIENKKFDKNIAKKTLFKTNWKGRLQIISKKPLIIVDGAHNKAGIDMLTNFLKQNKLPENKKIIFSLTEISKVNKSLINLLKQFDEIVVTENSFKKVEAKLIFNKIRPKLSHKIKITTSKKPFKAFKTLKEKSEENSFILVTGSLYILEEIVV